MGNIRDEAAFDPFPRDGLQNHKTSLSMKSVTRPKRRGRGQGLGPVRIGDLFKLFKDRYGSGVFPDDDSGLEDLIILLNHYAINNPLAMQRQIDMRAPWMDNVAAWKLIDDISLDPQRYTAVRLGQLLRFTGEEWRRLGTRTIAPIDMTKVERRAYSRQLAAARKQAKRRAAGQQPREDWLAAHQVKPWIAANCSKATYYRRLRKKDETGKTAIKIEDRNESQTSETGLTAIKLSFLLKSDLSQQGGLGLGERCISAKPQDSKNPSDTSDEVNDGDARPVSKRPDQLSRAELEAIYAKRKAARIIARPAKQ